MIVFDVETSGVNIHQHGILSIGAIDFNNPKNTFYGECRLWGEGKISEESIQINDITRESADDTSKPSEVELLQSFFDWASKIEDKTLAGHNPGFDTFFVKEATERNGLNYPFAHRSIDLHTVAIAHILQKEEDYPREKGRTAVNSDYVMRMVGIPDEPKPHNALNGTLWEAEAFSRLLFKKNLLPQFEEYPITL